MQIFESSAALQKQILELKNGSKKIKIGFVPTMGALHNGHLSLIKMALQSCDYVVCSIFVNPTQFNDKKDLEKYPRTLDSDLNMLKSAGCHAVFVPSESEVYPDDFKPENYFIEFDGLDQIMEGKFRPGHFKGVAMVVERLFQLVTPDQAFFGYKDFQQVAIIRKMVQKRDLSVQITGAPIIRESSGLAMSSRNQRLSETEKKKALIIHQTLLLGKEMASSEKSVNAIKNQMLANFENSDLQLEYIDIVDENSLEELTMINSNAICCIAAWCGDIRLIDNMSFAS